MLKRLTCFFLESHFLFTVQRKKLLCVELKSAFERLRRQFSSVVEIEASRWQFVLVFSPQATIDVLRFLHSIV